MVRVADRFTAGFDAEVVRAWIADDPDPVTREELSVLLDAALAGPDTSGVDTATDPAAARADLEALFLGPLEFGTAGLRGALGAGPHRMNRAVVIRAAAGLSAFLSEAVGPGFSVVIGCDARYGSVEFARDTAAVVTAAGGRAMLLPEHLPTPVTAFALTAFGADAGVMVTASHNPPQDNGYKVYLGEAPLRAVHDGRLPDAPAEFVDPERAVALAADGAGAQIVPPFDAMIATRIAAVESVATVPRAEEGWERLGDEVAESYLQSLEALGDRLGARRDGDLRVVLTSLHGVGGHTMATALRRAGFTDLHEVPAQSQPDPDFPTVDFPNPEEAGALDAAYALAAEVDADLVIANDPDADRFSAAVPVAGDGGTAGWRQLSGDEVGLLLGETVASRSSGGVLASSVVSSRGLAAVAQAHGLAHVPTLTGFKWISRVPGIVFGYEEALGYCVDPDVVRDKDGMSAALVFCGLVSRLAAAGRSVEDELARIRARDGVYLTGPLTFRLSDLSVVPGVLRGLLTAPPATLGGVPVSGVTDMSVGTDTLPPTTGVMVHMGADRVVVRPSGTEPKLKCYLEVVQAVPSGAESDVPAALDAARARLDGIRMDLGAYLGL
ncbi:phospho-sugar mutase [Brevibacterium litoralis]|uniref:phospho-sugar mutase n=1 Tax=Brevibacterium litoralis TaxID=3138935 RepID=UPI0032F067B9